MKSSIRQAIRRSSAFLLKLVPLSLLFSFAGLDQLVEQAIRDKAFPGAALVVLQENKIVYAKAFGTITYESETPITLDTLFDLASLTKPLVTAASIAKLCQEGKMGLEDPLALYFPESSSKIQICHLLSHTSGLAADIPPWFKEEEFITLERDEQQKRIWSYIFQEVSTAEPGKYLYSDLGFILLGKIVEKVSGLPLDQYFEQNFLQPLHLERTCFCPLDKGFLREEIAPTEVDSIWRNRIIHGTVHDEKAEVFDGIAGHAGLFSSAQDLIPLMQTIHHFSLGWLKESPHIPEGFSPEAFGHLGFTGNSLWIDPDKNIKILLLTNRVHPTRTNIQIRAFRRTLAHTLLSQS